MENKTVLYSDLQLNMQLLFKIVILKNVNLKYVIETLIFKYCIHACV